MCAAGTETLILNQTKFTAAFQLKTKNPSLCFEQYGFKQFSLGKDIEIREFWSRIGHHFQGNWSIEEVPGEKR